MEQTILAIIAGFIGGAIITVIGTLVFVRWQRQLKELSYRFEVRSFVLAEERERPGVKWDPNVKIMYQDREVEQLFPFKVAFRNTGNQPLEPLRIRLKPSPAAEILNLIVGHSSQVEVGDIKYNLTTGEEYEFELGFLNEGHEIVAYGIGTNGGTFGLTITVPQPGVKVRNRPEFWTSGEALKKALRIFAETNFLGRLLLSVWQKER